MRAKFSILPNLVWPQAKYLICLDLNLSVMWGCRVFKRIHGFCDGSDITWRLGGGEIALSCFHTSHFLGIAIILTLGYYWEACWCCCRIVAFQGFPCHSPIFSMTWVVAFFRILKWNCSANLSSEDWEGTTDLLLRRTGRGWRTTEGGEEVFRLKMWQLLHAWLP